MKSYEVTIIGIVSAIEEVQINFKNVMLLTESGKNGT